MTSLETSLAQLGHQYAPAALEPIVAVPDPEPGESQVGYDPMDVNLDVTPKVELEEEDEQEEVPEEEPKVEENEVEPVAMPKENRGVKG